MGVGAKVFRFGSLSTHSVLDDQSVRSYSFQRDSGLTGASEKGPSSVIQALTYFFLPGVGTP